MSEGKTLKEIALDLLEKYRMSETGQIWELSGSISEDTAKLEYECNYIRMQIERMAEPKWIPVSERLPNENVEVLVTVKVGEKTYIESGMLSSINRGQWETIYDRYVIDVYGRNRNSKVIAWMPLPEPYKGGDAE